MSENISEIPIIGMWYKVTSGVFKNWCGECISFDPAEKIPVILQDLNYESRAFYVDEIERTIRHPTYKKDISRDQKS